LSEIKPRIEENGRVNGEQTPAAERPWFFSGLTETGAIIKEYAESSSAFRAALDTAPIAWVDHVARADFNKEALEAAMQLGFSREIVSPLLEESFTTYLDLDTELGMKIPSIQVHQMEVDPSPLLILIKKNFICTIHTLSVDRRFSRLRRYGETILKKIPASAPSSDRLSMLLTRIIDHNNDRNFEHLRQIEEQGDKLNAIMMDPYVPRTTLGPEIYRMKHALLTYLDALWNTVDVLHTLRYGDAELITDERELLDRLWLLSEDVNRQIGLAEHMSDVMSSGLEVLQSIYNNQLQSLNNRLMLFTTYLTIVGTAVLVPNTIATVMGNSAFAMDPGDRWWYILLIIGSTLLSTALVYWWVRKKGWIPRKMD
jgi:magnesium transporter